MGIYKGLCGFWSIDFQKSTKSINKGHIFFKECENLSKKQVLIHIYTQGILEKKEQILHACL